MEYLIGGLIGGAIVFVLMIVFKKKVEAVETTVVNTFEADKAELATLEAKYGAEIKTAVGTLSADAQKVVARYHELKAKVAAVVGKL